MQVHGYVQVLVVGMINLRLNVLSEFDYQEINVTTIKFRYIYSKKYIYNLNNSNTYIFIFLT